MRRTMTVLALVAGLLSSGGVAQAAPDTAPLGPGVEQRAVFNDPTVVNVPTHPHNDYNIAREHIKLLDGAPAGATVRISTWRWTLADMTNAADRAVRRGVDVRIALNSASETYAETKRLKSLLGSRVTYCGKGYGNGACTSTRSGGTQHVKVTTASASGSKRHLVLVTASNMDWGQVGGSFNDLLITSGDQACYDKVTNYLRDAVTQRQRGTNYRASSEGHFSCPGSRQTWWLGPEAHTDGSMNTQFSTDTRAKELDKIRGGPGCAVRILQSKIDDTRYPVVKQYQDAKARGCIANAITRMEGDSTADKVRGMFAASSIPWRTHIRSESSTVTRHNHSKVDIVRDPGGVDFVLSGSENATRDNRRNDEVVVKSTAPGTVKAYEDWYKALYARK